jgi:hypothetical protein
LKKGEWTFITNHGRVLAYLSRDPMATAQQMAFETGLSMRAVFNIVEDLREGGYVSWVRVGRRNRYTVYSNRPMRHPLETGHRVGEMLAAIGSNGHTSATAVARSGMQADHRKLAKPSLTLVTPTKRRTTERRATTRRNSLHSQRHTPGERV